MEFTYAINQNILVITFDVNRLDAKKSMQTKSDILKIIKQEENWQVVFNFNQVIFMDSSGVGILLSILRFLNTKEGELKLAEIPPTLRTIFELVSLHKIFETYNTVDEAIHSFITSKKR